MLLPSLVRRTSRKCLARHAKRIPALATRNLGHYRPPAGGGKPACCIFHVAMRIVVRGSCAASCLCARESRVRVEPHWLLLHHPGQRTWGAVGRKASRENHRCGRVTHRYTPRPSFRPACKYRRKVWRGLMLCPAWQGGRNPGVVKQSSVQRWADHDRLASSAMDVSHCSPALTLFLSRLVHNFSSSLVAAPRRVAPSAG